MVYSLGRTKIFWYVVPIYPIVSIALAIVAERLLRLLPHRPARPVQLGRVAVALLAVYMVGEGLVQKAFLLPHLEDTPQGRYGRSSPSSTARGSAASARSTAAFPTTTT